MGNEFPGVLGKARIDGYKETVVAVGMDKDDYIIAVCENTDVVLLLKSEFEEDLSLKISGKFNGFVTFLDIMHDFGRHKENLLRRLRRES